MVNRKFANIKYIAAVVLVILVTALMFTGCSSTEKETSEEETTTTEGKIYSLEDNGKLLVVSVPEAEKGFHWEYEISDTALLKNTKYSVPETSADEDADSGNDDIPMWTSAFVASGTKYGDVILNIECISDSEEEEETVFYKEKKEAPPSYSFVIKVSADQSLKVKSITE